MSNFSLLAVFIYVGCTCIVVGWPCVLLVGCVYLCWFDV